MWPAAPLRLPLRYVLPEPARQQAQKVLERAFEGGSEALVADHAELRAQEQENARVLNTRGDLPEALAAEYERLRKSYEALHRWGPGLCRPGMY